MTTVLPKILANTGVFYALAPDQVDTPAEFRGYAVLLAAGARITDPTEIHHRVGKFVWGPRYFHTVIREYVDAVAYLPPTAGAIDSEVADQVDLAHLLGKPVYAIIGRELIEVPAPLRLAA